MQQGKMWGKTEPIIVTPLMQLHRITIVPNARSSTHRHMMKWNAFYCVEGQIEIHVKRVAYDLTDITVLHPGESTTVQPGEDHWFQTGDQPAVVLEIYYLEPLGEDIVRQDAGRLLVAPAATSTATPAVAAT